MHTCPPWTEALAVCLNTCGSSHNSHYGDLHLDYYGEAAERLLYALRPYFESAHSDAPEHFHKKVPEYLRRLPFPSTSRATNLKIHRHPHSSSKNGSGEASLSLACPMARRDLRNFFKIW